MSNSKSINGLKFVFSLLCIMFFLAVIVNADKFYRGSDPVFVNSSFVQIGQENSDSLEIDVIGVSEDGNEKGVLQYVVQPGDNLGKIANIFGVTISHIQKINNLKAGASIKPKQKLIITDEEDGFIYVVKSKENVSVFANKYGLNLKDFMTLNYIQDETEILTPGQEVFVNMSLETAYNAGIKERPIVQIVPKVTKVAYKPTISKPEKGKTTKKKVAANDNGGDNLSASSSSKIIRKRSFKKSINNGFYMGHCTWYVATQVPEIFPYSDEDSQSRPFGGNANEWYGNAKKAGFSVGQSPRVGAIIVYQNGRRRRGAGHVGIVIGYYPDEGKMIIRDMNRAGKFIVTERREETSNSNIKGYIYRPKEAWKPGS